MPDKCGETYHVDAGDARNIFDQVGSTEFIKRNPAYRETYDGLYFYVSDSDVINAFSMRLSDDVREMLSRDLPGVNWGRYVGLICIHAGMLRWITVVATVCEYIDRTHRIGEAKRMLRWAAGRLTRFSAGSDFVKRFVDEFGVECDGQREEIVRMYGMALLAALYGHEIGHSCLNHNSLGLNSMSRNNECQADLFASSVIQSMGMGYAGAIGAVMLMLSFIWEGGRFSSYMTKEELKNPSKYETHPESIERVVKLIESFNTILDRAPINTKQLLKLAKKG